MSPTNVSPYLSVDFVALSDQSGHQKYTNEYTATVELFRDFGSRYQRVFKRKPSTVFLRENYRSTKRILKLVNDFATLDTSFQAVRVASKPILKYPKSADEGVPILCMFRDSLDELARDLGTFVHDVFRRKGYRLPDGTKVQCNSKGGDVGDCAV